MAKTSVPQIPFAQRWQTWQKCLYDETDQNSLANQFLTFNHFNAIYLMTLEDRRIILDHYPQNPPLNVQFHYMLDRIFFESQAIRLRRIRDTENSSINYEPKRDVCSLNALLKDLKAHRSELTRKQYLALHQNYFSANTSPNNPDLNLLEYIQEIFDRISGSSPSTRSDTDLPADAIFDLLTNLLNQNQDVFDHIDKFIAHLATTTNRQITLTDQKLLYTEVLQAFKNCYLVFTALFSMVHIELPFLLIEPTPTLTEHWHSTQLDPKNKSVLLKVYNNSAKEFLNWNNTILPNLLQKSS